MKNALSAGYSGGSGTVGATQVNTGGILAPGNGTPGSSLTIAGNLAFQSGAVYLVQVGSFANVTGSVTLGGVLSTMTPRTGMDA